MSIRKISTKPAALRSLQDPAVERRKICSLLTHPLGLLGWETLEPVLLAALTTRDPLLLIGKHGTGKSFLLERLAQALGLVYPKERELQDVAWDSSSALRAAIRARWPSPGDLFTQIGHPKTLQITADFLIGWRVGTLPETNSCYFCPDPQLVAGVQARCSGDLYLSRRNPDLRWERLLSAPIAFDEPGISALLL